MANTFDPEKFLADLLKNLLADKRVRDIIQQLHDNATELSTLITQQISNHAIEDAIISSCAPDTSHTPTTPKTIDEKPQKNHGKRGKRVVNWANASNISLRLAVQYRKKHNLPIEPELNTELAARFHGWDAENHVFTGKRKTRIKTTASPAPKTSVLQKPKNTENMLVPLYSVPTDNGSFSLFFDNGTQKKRLLSRTTQPYDLCLYDIKTKYAVVRKISESGNAGLYIIDCNTGTIIPETKMGINFVYWVNGSHDLYALKKIDSLRSGHHIMEFGRTTKPVIIPANAKTIRAALLGGNTIILDANGNAQIGDCIRLANIDNATQQNERIKKIWFQPKTEHVPTVTQQNVEQAEQVNSEPSAPEQAPEQPTPSAPASSEQATAPQELRITVKPIKTTLQGTYNDVIVNGIKILSHHVDTEIRLMSDSALLAVHGIVTDDKRLPQTPQWRVYYADLSSAIPPIKQPYSDYNAHATAIHQLPDQGVKIDMSNRCLLFLKIEKIRKIAANRKFVLCEKQK